MLLRVVEADRVIPVRPRGRAGCGAGPISSRVGSRKEPFLPWAIQQTSCVAGTGRASPGTHRPGFGGTSFPARAVNWNSLRVPCTESALGHTHHPSGGQEQKARPRPPAASKLGPRGSTSSGAGAGKPPLSGTKQGPQCLKSGFASCFSQGPGASCQFLPRMFCSPPPPPRHHHHQPAGPRELTREPEGWAPSPPLRGPGLSLSAPLLSRGGRSKKQTVDTTMSCSSRLFVFKSHVGVSSP